MNLKLTIAFLIDAIAWMFLGMSFFLNWPYIIELSIIGGLTIIGLLTIKSWYKDMKKEGKDSLNKDYTNNGGSE